MVSRYTILLCIWFAAVGLSLGAPSTLLKRPQLPDDLSSVVKEPVGECPSLGAWNTLIRSGESGPFGSLIATMRLTGLTEEMKKLAEGKAILAPTNGAIAKSLSRLTFVTKASSFQPKQWSLTADGKQKLHDLIAQIFVPAPVFRQVVKPSDPCRLIAAVYDQKKGLEALVNRGSALWPNQFAVASTSGRKLLAECEGVPSCNFNTIGLGSGYNVYTGSPSTTLAGGVDPGIIYNAIFDFTNSPTVQVSSGGGSCAQSNAMSVTYSYSNYQSQQESKVQGSGSYGDNSFSASTEWSSTTDTTNANKAATYSGGTTVNLYSYNFPKSASALQVTSSFATLCWYILQDYAREGNKVGQFTNSDLRQLFTSYGTSYVVSMQTGGIANTFIQMSATGESSLSTDSISVSAEATACFGLSSGSVSGSYDSSTASTIKKASAGGTFSYQLAPSTVRVPLASGGKAVDCSTWSQWMKGNSTQAPMTYTIADISLIFSSYRAAFTTTYPCASGTTAGTSTSMCFTKDDLITLTTLVSNYMANCAPDPTSCKTTSKSCNKGYFGAGYNSATGATDCKSCYTAGYKCNTNQDCNSTTGQCINTASTTNTGLYAVKYDTYFGLNSQHHDCPAPWTTTSGRTVLQKTTTSNLYQFQYQSGINQLTLTWQFTGYFVPSGSYPYYFLIQSDNCAYLWLDAPSTGGGAKTNTPSSANAIISAPNHKKRYATKNPISLTAGQPYPIRIQYGNEYGNNPSYFTMGYSFDNKNWIYMQNGAGGTFYHYPVTTSSPTAPGF